MPTVKAKTIKSIKDQIKFQSESFVKENWLRVHFEQKCYTSTKKVSREFADKKNRYKPELYDRK